ncbi:hypothetical protein [Lysobacter enzymogenes]|uniref:hypothetical protein n=1 Tax=Lysobacter enzymogenes TaxID=69 RepID=UPI001A96D6BB|nr:hypothetical protein [Lysobacter enzymogenes]QQP96461.1 hypothetical protein JHW38_25245 [Lysobacter enzymogenes]QQP96495.1 hypothetical protein JHW38_00095 [Lysobacter enzymogenes]
MAYIRLTYGVPAKRGMRVEYMSGRDLELMEGVIVGSKGQHLRIRLDGNRHSGFFHPTYNLVYITPEGRHSTTDQTVYGDEAAA